jgi:hypothetical protein
MKFKTGLVGRLMCVGCEQLGGGYSCLPYMTGPFDQQLNLANFTSLSASFCVPYLRLISQDQLSNICSPQTKDKQQLSKEVPCEIMGSLFEKKVYTGMQAATWSFSYL